MATKNRRPKAIDLFCGAGGMSLGFEQAGFDIALGVDRDPYHCAAHERNFPYGKTLCASVAELTSASIRELSGIRGEIDLIFGGPPCQGFSTMGKRDSGDPRNSLVGEFVRIVSELKPRAFVMENVPGMQLGGTRAYFEFVIETLSNSGYRIALPAKTLMATEFGAPQRRERLFVIGVRKDQPNAPQYPPGALKSQPKASNVGEAFQGLPNLDGERGLYLEDTIKFSPSKKAKLSPYASVLSGLKKDPTDLSYPRKSKSGLLFGNKLSKHSADSIALYTATQPGQMVPGHKLPRLDPKGFSPTLRAGSESERGSHTAPRPIHPFIARCITVREAARLHGFPDWFAFYPKVHHGFRQVGNSVSPLVARAVGYQVTKALEIDRSKLTPTATLYLKDEFLLPEGRPKHQGRISHLDEFPKVVNWIFESKYDAETRQVRSPGISVRDITAAMKATEANMPRIRPERFISEFSRTRNAREIMAMPLSRGYSIIEDASGARFVPKGTPGAIGSSNYVSFNSAEIRGSIPIDANGKDSIERAFDLLKKTNLVGKIVRARDLFAEAASDKQSLRVETAHTRKNAVFWHARKNKPIKRESVAKLMTEYEATTAIVCVELTPHHTGIIIFEQSGRGMAVAQKKVFLFPKAAA